ncbi:hypothetical protein KIN20_025961 [Parelaphostrongylus tenuis]|uniref:Uncharacterized protein n=1 Tax=Parelaphostrongylus tenuis TaxID=148309 RepID=A0AAD5NC75_PARTN|nr:hypothetical protein KIN20_025961 [Parelaphostrongylus tenuis]
MGDNSLRGQRTGKCHAKYGRDGNKESEGGNTCPFCRYGIKGTNKVIIDRYKPSARDKQQQRDVVMKPRKQPNNDDNIVNSDKHKVNDGLLIIESLSENDAGDTNVLPRIHLAILLLSPS